jgi:hypothetical protein
MSPSSRMWLFTTQCNNHESLKKDVALHHKAQQSWVPQVGCGSSPHSATMSPSSRMWLFTTQRNNHEPLKKDVALHHTAQQSWVPQVGCGSSPHSATIMSPSSRMWLFTTQRNNHEPLKEDVASSPHSATIMCPSRRMWPLHHTAQQSWAPQVGYGSSPHSATIMSPSRRMWLFTTQRNNHEQSETNRRYSTALLCPYSRGSEEQCKISRKRSQLSRPSPSSWCCMHKFKNKGCVKWIAVAIRLVAFCVKEFVICRSSSEICFFYSSLSWSHYFP